MEPNFTVFVYTSFPTAIQNPPFLKVSSAYSHSFLASVLTLTYLIWLHPYHPTAAIPVKVTVTSVMLSLRVLFLPFTLY